MNEQQYEQQSPLRRIIRTVLGCMIASLVFVLIWSVIRLFSPSDDGEEEEQTSQTQMVYGDGLYTADGEYLTL